MQLLFRGQGDWIKVDRSWRDNGRDPEYGIVGGQKIRISDKVRPFPEIFQSGDNFIYANGKPLDKVEDIGPHIPEPYASLMREFIENRKEVPEPEPLDLSPKEEKKGRGRPKKPTSVRIEIKDEETLVAHGGVAF